jgi:hypothetical protein
MGLCVRIITRPSCVGPTWKASESLAVTLIEAVVQWLVCKSLCSSCVLSSLYQSSSESPSFSPAIGIPRN